VSAEAATTVASHDERRANRRVALTTAFAGLAAILCFVKFGLTGEAFVSAVFAVSLVVLSATDLEERKIPNRIVLPAAGFVLVAHIALDPGKTLEWTLASVAAFVGFLVLALVNPAGLGMGDVKLAFLLGAGLGWKVVAALLLGTFAAGLYGAVLIFTRGRSGLKTSFPLGPFLAGAALLVLFLS
jgi:leader peptidase (prepilin peptidase) / N-methyltransferase